MIILRHTTLFLVDPIHSIFYLGPKIWGQMPTEIKNKNSRRV